MASIPRRVGVGQKLEASWANQLLDYIQSITVSAGVGILAQRTPYGTTLSAMRSRASASSGPSAAPASSSTVLAIITGGSNGAYTADLYANGYDEDATETNVPLQILEISYGETVPSGTQVVVFPCMRAATGSGE